MNGDKSRDIWFYVLRIWRFPLMWFPISWKGWLLVAALISAVIGVVMLGALLHLIISHSNIILLAIVLIVLGFQILVFKHSK